MTDKQAFGVIVRAVGLWFLIQAFSHCIILITGIVEAHAIPALTSQWFISPLVYILVGVLLLKRPDCLVAWAYKGKSAQD